jgi:hypothetical protein
MTLFPCPSLGVLVELTDERQRHILLKHPDLLPAYIDHIAETAVSQRLVSLLAGLRILKLESLLLSSWLAIPCL